MAIVNTILFAAAFITPVFVGEYVRDLYENVADD